MKKMKFDFTKPRPIITSKEALKDVIPVEWDDDVLKGKAKVEIKLINGKVTAVKVPVN